MVYGTSDVIVIQQKDGLFKSTPFYVRFGKKEVFRTRDKLVSIKVNNDHIPGLNMRLDENGDGYFSTDFSSEERISLFRRIFANGHRKKLHLEDEDTVFYSESLEILNDDDESLLPEIFETKFRNRRNSRSLTNLNEMKIIPMEKKFEKRSLLKPSNYLKMLRTFRSMHVPESTNTEEFKSPSLNKNKLKKCHSTQDEQFGKQIEFFKLKEAEMKNEIFTIYGESILNSKLTVPDGSIINNVKSNLKDETQLELDISNIKKKSLSIPRNTKMTSFRKKKASKLVLKSEEIKSPRLYKKNLKECYSASDEKLSYTISQSSEKEQKEDILSSAISDESLFEAESKEKSRSLSDLNKSKALKKEKKSLINSSNEIKGIFDRRRSYSETDLSLFGKSLQPRQEKKSANESFKNKLQNLTSHQLKSLNLRPGINSITYSINSDTKKILASIFLWNYDEKLIACDIDGTITKSDIRGRLSQYIGFDWFHDGVANLFAKLHINSYKIIYVSARAFVEFEKTQSLIKKINQNGVTMPQGPIILNPSGLVDAFSTEVISKTAYMFKIETLKSIKNLFDINYNPFYAGFGNKTSDRLTYRTVGIKDSLIFITNHDGSIYFDQRSDAPMSYKVLHDFINDYFPIDKFNVNITDDVTHL